MSLAEVLSAQNRALSVLSLLWGRPFELSLFLSVLYWLLVLVARKCLLQKCLVLTASGVVTINRN